MNMKMVQQHAIRALLMAVIGASLVTGACGGTEEAPPAGQPAVDVSGLWQGTWRTDTNSSSGGVTVTLVQSSTQLTGQGTLTNIPLVKTQQGPFTGNIDGRTISGVINAALADVTFAITVAPDGRSASGSYSMTGGVQGLLNLSR